MSFVMSTCQAVKQLASQPAYFRVLNENKVINNIDEYDM